MGLYPYASIIVLRKNDFRLNCTRVDVLRLFSLRIDQFNQPNFVHVVGYGGGYSRFKFPNSVLLASIVVNYNHRAIIIIISLIYQLFVKLCLCSGGCPRPKDC